PKFWDMICGELTRVVIDIRRRDIDNWLIGGNYENDREYRRRFHKWLGDIWTEKDLRFDEMLLQYRKPPEAECHEDRGT
ncbi:MAG: hypothetical protein KDI09_20780, partial [Halioglobus sp.]|nr:hypothetical protein [Halioglobus sp.]